MHISFASFCVNQQDLLQRPSGDNNWINCLTLATDFFFQIRYISQTQGLPAEYLLSGRKPRPSRFFNRGPTQATPSWRLKVCDSAEMEIYQTLSDSVIKHMYSTYCILWRHIRAKKNLRIAKDESRKFTRKKITNLPETKKQSVCCFFLNRPNSRRCLFKVWMLWYCGGDPGLKSHVFPPQVYIWLGHPLQS